MKNKEILKTVLKDIWINYWFLLSVVYPLFAFLFWLEREDLQTMIGISIAMLLIAFGGVFFIIGYGIKQFIKLRKND